MKQKLFISIIILLFTVSAFAGTTGKIAGIVTDAVTGEPLPGVNIILKDMLMGAATDMDGYYVILNVPPGTYELEASMVGYALATVTKVNVKIDQTSSISFKLREETMEVDIIEVVAERPVVEIDVAASRANISAEEIESIPVVSVRSVVALQAGVEGFSFRGSDTESGRLGSDEVAIVVNGLTLRDERDNQPFTLVSLTAVDEVQVQSGGFSAEYGNFRSGMVNVVTKEGGRDKYSFSFLGRYKEPAPKHFGPSPSSKNSFWVRPFLDDDVCWTGTDNGAWDKYTQSEYYPFEGWNSISEELLNDDNPDNDYTPEMAQRIYRWQHRRDLEIRDPDFNVDFSIGGPVPFVSKDLGNLRFNTSFVTSQNMYVMPLSRDAYRNYMWQLKLTSDIATGMKLMVDGFISEEWGTARYRNGTPGIFWTSGQIASEMSNGPKYIEARMFGTDYWTPSEVFYTSIGIKFTHTLNSTTYYETSLHRFSSKYDTNPGRRRNTDEIYYLGEGIYWNEEPLGYYEESANAINGMRMGVGFSNSRDSSFIATYSAKFDITSQVNKINNLKAGGELIITDSRVNYASFDKFLPSGNARTKWEKTPVRFAAYVQDKLEFEGMVAQLGLRLDYFNAGGTWFSDYDPYDPAFSPKYSDNIDELLNKEHTKSIINLSPRLGISFPITENSKIYFNYGHFYQLPSPENLFIIRRYDETGQITRIADPNKPLPRTVSYELGFDQNIMDQVLIRAAGYYKDISDQPRSVQYISNSNSVDYYVYEPNSYEDIRGFELTLNKNRGDWFRGFVNYTYMVSTYGYFGYSEYNDSPAEQRKFIKENKKEHYQSKPIPRPFARLNLDFFTPLEYGPELMGFKPLEDWRMTVLADWKAGNYFTYVGGGAAPPGIQYNLQWTDYYNVNLRFSKIFRWKSARFELFADIENVFNFKRMTTYGFFDTYDRQDYYNSLHLPKSTEGIEFFPNNIPGDDRPGDYRKSGVEYVPMVGIDDISMVNEIDNRILYYEFSTKDYYRWIDGELVKASKSYVNKVLDNKAYIDMPNLTHFTFLDPREVFWGIRVSFEL